jgi:putative glutamine amidotransferase
MRPVIVGVSLRVTLSQPHGEARDAISHDWIRFLEEHAASPVLIPNALRDPAAFADRAGVRALLLTSGGDVSSQPGEAPDDANADALERLRDGVERTLLDWAIRRRVPVLGVCRGMQAINVYFGGGLIRDLGQAGVPALSHAGRPHRVRLMPSGKTAMTNSFHRHGVTAEVLSNELLPLAMDGELVEAVAHRRLPVFGMQWHPERPGSAAGVDRRLITRWLGPRGRHTPAPRRTRMSAR